MKKRWSKKAIITISALAATVLVAGIALAIGLAAGGEQVEVVPVAQVMNTWIGGSATTSGIVQSHMAQSIPYSASDIIVKMHVQEGDEVNIGDPLVEYDVTALDLQKKLKELEVQRLELELTQLSEELAEIQALNPGDAKIAAVPEAGQTVLRLAVEPGSVLNKGELDDTAVYYNETPPAGTEQDPYLFLCASGTKIRQSFVQKMLDLAVLSGNTIYAWVEYREGDTVLGELLYAYIMSFDPKGDFSFVLDLPIQEPEPSPTEEPEPGPSEEPEPSPSEEPEPSVSQEPEPSLEPEPPIPPVPGYTEEELNQMETEKEEEIRDKRLEKKRAELELKKAEAQLAEEGIVRSVVQGEVKVAADQSALQEGEPLILVMGGDGYYVQGMIGEMSLEDIQVGDPAYVMNYMDGMSYEGSIVEISDVPAQTSGFSENPNESAYTFTVHINEDAALNVGDYVEVSYGNAAPPEQGGSIYIDKMYVREEDGESYMFIAEEGKLKRKAVQTGKTLQGWYIEIKEGLGVEDYIAFPYGKLAKDGTKVKMPEDMQDNGVAPLGVSIS